MSSQPEIGCSASEQRARPFHVYAPGGSRPADGKGPFEAGRTWAYAVSAGSNLADAWSFADFENDLARLRVHGPNGFYREFLASADSPPLAVSLETRPGGGSPGALLTLKNRGTQRGLTVVVEDLSYGTGARTLELAAGDETKAGAQIEIALANTQGWYDFLIRIPGFPRFEARYAGHVENGQDSTSDPLMGGASA